MNQRPIKHIKKCPICDSTRINYNESHEMRCAKCGFVFSKLLPATRTSF